MASLRDLLFSQFVSGAENTFLKVGTLGTTVQPLLVSNTNIKTVLGQTLLGSGNITIAAGDVPNLDASKITSGTIAAARLPSYVDDVLEFANLAALPVTGETGKIYVALDTNKVYRWSGSAYIEISPAPDLSGYLPLSGGTLTGNITLNAGTANGIAYLNGSKVLTTGSALTFDGSGVLTVGSDSVATVLNAPGDVVQYVVDSNGTGAAASHQWRYGSTEAMRLNSTGLGIGTNSPATKLDVVGQGRVLYNTGATNTGDQNVVTVGATTTGAYAASYGAGLQFQVTNNSGGYSGGRIVSRLGADNFTANLVFQARNYGFSDSMTLDSNGRLLVGHNSPVNDNNLPVQLSAPINQVRFFAVNKATDYGIIFGYDNASNYGDIRVVPSAAMVLSTNNTERVRITAAGDVGIGTASPGDRLTVASGRIRLDQDFQIVWQNAGTNRARLHGDSGSNLIFETGSGNAEGMRLTSSGNLGIGTSSPGARLDVATTTGFTYSETSSAGVRIGTQGTAGGSFMVQTASLNSSYGSGFVVDGTYSSGKSTINLKAFGVYSGGPYSADIAFFTSTNTTLSEKMRLDNAGRLLVGVTTAATGIGLLQIGQSATNTAVASIGTSDVNRTALLLTNFTGATGNNKVVVGFDNSGRGGFEVGMPAATNAFYIYDTLAATERVRIDNSGNVGIGTSSPGTRLDVDGNIRSNAWIGRANGSAPSADCAIYRAADNTLAFSTASAERMRITSGGLVGINTTNPAGRLHVVTNSAADSVRITSSSGSNPAGIVYTTAGVQDWSVGVSGNAFVFSAGNIFAGNEYVRIASNGNFAVGTTMTDVRMQVHGPMYVPAANFKGVLAVNGTESQAAGNGAGITLGGVFTGSSVTTFAQIAGIKENSTDANFAGALALYTRPNGDTLAERARITSGGQVLIGTTSANGTLTVEDKVSTNGIEILTLRSTASGGRTFLRFRDANNNFKGEVGFADGGNLGDNLYLWNRSGSDALIFGTNNTERVRIASNGAVGLSGANYGRSGLMLSSNGSGSAPTWGCILSSESTTDWGNGVQPSGRGWPWKGALFHSGYVAAGATSTVLNIYNEPNGLFMIELTRADGAGGPYGNITGGGGMELHLVQTAHHGWSGGSSTLIASSGTLHGSYTTSSWYQISITGGTGGTYYRIMWAN